MSTLRNVALRPFQPQRFGRFTLLAPLAAGGMGQIYLARARFAGGLEKLCVIKKVLPELARDADFAARFRDEAQTLIQLQHGSIAQVYDSGEEAGEWWIALEFVDGKDLRRLLQRMRGAGHRVPLAIALYVAVKVLEALAYAHRKKDRAGNELGLVHRDVSPQNVLLSYEGEVKVIDFGLARSATTAPEADPSVVMGKFHYMAPEQARNLPLDRRADLYAVGVILYELVTGWNPLEEASGVEIVEWAASPRIPPVQRLAPELPESVAAAVTKAIAVDPAARFASAEEMRGRLAACLSEVAPDAGPEALAELLCGVFAEEHARERAWMSSLARIEGAEGEAPFGTEQAVEPGSDPFATGATQAAKPASGSARLVPWNRDQSAGSSALRSAAAAASSVPRPLPWYDTPAAGSGSGQPLVPMPERTPQVPIPLGGEPAEQAAVSTGLPEGGHARVDTQRGRRGPDTEPAQAEVTALGGDTLRVAPVANDLPEHARADAGGGGSGAQHALDTEPGRRKIAPAPAAGAAHLDVDTQPGRRRTDAAPAIRRRIFPAIAALAAVAAAIVAVLALPREPAPQPEVLVVRGFAAREDVEVAVAAEPAPVPAPPVEAPEQAPAPAEPAPEEKPVVAAPRPQLAVARVHETAVRAEEPPRQPAVAPRPEPVDPRQGLIARRQQVMRKYESLVRDHGADQVGGIVAGLVRATDSQFQRVIDDPGHHDDLQRQLEELDRLLEERRRAFDR